MTESIEKPYSHLIREFTYINVSASESIKPLIAELKLKHFPTLETLKNEEVSIKFEMRKSLPIDEQELLSKTDKLKHRKNKSEEEKFLMTEREKSQDRIKYLWNQLVKEMFPLQSFVTPVKSSNLNAKMSKSGGDKRNSLNRPSELTTTPYNDDIRVSGNAAPVENQYLNVPETLKVVQHNPYYDSHHFDLPLRMCIAAPAGSGKTNFLVSLIKKFNPISAEDATFSEVCILSPNANEPLYNSLKLEMLTALVIKHGLNDLQPIDEIENNKQRLICFDDCMNEDQNVIVEYYTRGRNRNVSVIFLAQDYYSISKIIRQNAD